MSRLLRWKSPGITMGLLALSALLVSPAAAGINGTAYTITATNSAGSASWSVPAPTGDSHYWDWTTTQRIEMRDSSSGNLVAVLNPNNEGCSVHYVDDPVIGLGFAVAAGALPTNFVISSGLLSFPVLAAAEARASAAYTLTDLNGDGATLTPTAAKSYTATYNGATTFATLISAFGSPAFTSTPSSESNPVGPGFIPLGVGVSSMQADVEFTLSAGDLASGTTVFVVQQRPVPVEHTTWGRIKALAMVR